MNRLNFFQNRPKASKIDVTAYLDRIKTDRQVPTIRYLKSLQKAHLLHIPFENLDIHYGTKIVLKYEDIFEKVIIRKRGGFCHELNGLFYHLLYHLGFECHIISGRFWDKGKQCFGKPFEHMAIVVKIDDGSWFVDVGFGDGPISPLKIKTGAIQMDYTKYWKVDQNPDDLFILKVSNNASDFETRLLFSTEERQLIQFMEICDFQQSSKESVFTQNKLITKLTPTGRVTLTDKQITINDLGVVSKSPILHEDEFLSKLLQHFDIKFQQLIPPPKD